MTRGRLIARVAAKIGLNTDEELLFMQEWANEAVMDVLLKTHCRVELGDLALTPNVGDYRIDSEVMAVDARTISANTVKIRVVSIEDIYDLRRIGGAPTELTFLAIEGDLALVYPTPTAATTIRYVYVAQPLPMNDDANDPSSSSYGGIPSEYHRALEYYMLWQASEYASKERPLTPKDYAAIYVEEVKDIRRAVRRKQRRGASMAHVGYPERAGIPRRNDVYPSY